MTAPTEDVEPDGAPESDTDETAEKEHAGGMICLVPDTATAANLALDGDGAEPTDQLHLTLVYLGDDVTSLPDDVREALRGATESAISEAGITGPVEARVFAHTTFNADGGPDGDMDSCAVYGVGDTDLVVPLHDKIMDAVGAIAGFELPDQHTPFAPHVTAAYGKTAADLSYLGPVTFDRVAVVIGPDWHMIPLAGEAPGAEPVESADAAASGDAEMSAAPDGPPESDAVKAARQALADAQMDGAEATAAAQRQVQTAQETAARAIAAAQAAVYEAKLAAEPPARPAAAIQAAEAVPELTTGDEYGEEWPVRFPAMALVKADTSDGRYLRELLSRACPMSILAQPFSSHGGQQPPPSVVVGRVDRVEMLPGPQVISRETGQPFAADVDVWVGHGHVDPTADVHGLNLGKLLKRRYLNGASVDLSGMDVEIIGEGGLGVDPDNPRRRMIANTATIAAITLVPIPAFADAYVELVDQDVPAEPVAPEDLPAGLAASAFPAWRSAEVGDYPVEALTAAIGIPATPAAPAADVEQAADTDRPTPPAADSYVEAMRNLIGAELGDDEISGWGDNTERLLDLYTLLAFTTGPDTTSEHVHDAWAVAVARTDAGHAALIPFDRLPADKQALDVKYRDAIITAAGGAPGPAVDEPAEAADEDGADSGFAISQEERDDAASRGTARADGSFPIRTEEELDWALRSVGRAKDQEAARRHIMERAKKLRLEHKIPAHWNADGTTSDAAAGTTAEVFAQHDLIFYEGRSTPKVVSKGADAPDAPESWGKQTSRRAATADEEKKIANGDWVRVDSSGKKPGDAGYDKSNIRPHLADDAPDVDLDQWEPVTDVGMPDTAQPCATTGQPADESEVGEHPATQSLIFDDGQQYTSVCAGDDHHGWAVGQITDAGYQVEHTVPIEPASDEDAAPAEEAAA